MFDIWYRITHHEALQCEYVKTLLEKPQNSFQGYDKV